MELPIASPSKRFSSQKKVNGLRKTGSRVSFDFDESIMVVDDISSQKNASWYSPAELKDFRQSSSSSPNGNKRSIKRRSSDLVQALLTVQSEHKALGIQDPRGLRQMSRACSKNSIREALYRAKDTLKDEPGDAIFPAAG